MSSRKSHSNNSVLRLLKQVEESNQDYIEFHVKPLRGKCYKSQVDDEKYWDYPKRSNTGRCWKRHRQTQHK